MTAPSRSTSLVACALDDRVELRAHTTDAELEPIDRTRHRFVFAVGDRTVYIYALGAVVVIGASALDDEMTALVERCSACKILPATIDAYRVEVDESAARPHAQWDRIVVPKLDDEILETCALVLARSAGLERYEHAADPLLEAGLALSRQFAGRGRPPWGARGMIRRMAALAVQRLELARWFVHLDRPELAWDDPTVDRLYDVLRDHVELAERHEALQQRVASLEHSLSTIVSAWESRRSRALEWAIIWLIVVEIVLAVLHV